MEAAIVVWNILLLIVTILVIVDSVKKVRQGKTDVLATDVFVVKLVAIPFFVVNFAVMATFGLGGSLILIFGGVILLAIAITSIGLTYIAMLSVANVFALGVIVTIVGFALAFLTDQWESFSLLGWINPVSVTGVALALATAVVAIVRTVLLRRRAQAALVS